MASLVWTFSSGGYGKPYDSTPWTRLRSINFLPGAGADFYALHPTQGLFLLRDNEPFLVSLHSPSQPISRYVDFALMPWRDLSGKPQLGFCMITDLGLLLWPTAQEAPLLTLPSSNPPNGYPVGSALTVTFRAADSPPDGGLVKDWYVSFEVVIGLRSNAGKSQLWQNTVTIGTNNHIPPTVQWDSIGDFGLDDPQEIVWGSWFALPVGVYVLTRGGKVFGATGNFNWTDISPADGDRVEALTHVGPFLIATTRTRGLFYQAPLTTGWSKIANLPGYPITIAGGPVRLREFQQEYRLTISFDVGVFYSDNWQSAQSTWKAMNAGWPDPDAPPVGAGVGGGGLASKGKDKDQDKKVASKASSSSSVTPFSYSAAAFMNATLDDDGLHYVACLFNTTTKNYFGLFARDYDYRLRTAGSAVIRSKL